MVEVMSCAVTRNEREEQVDSQGRIRGNGYKVVKFRFIKELDRNWLTSIVVNTRNRGYRHPHRCLTEQSKMDREHRRRLA